MPVLMEEMKVAFDKRELPAAADLHARGYDRWSTRDLNQWKERQPFIEEFGFSIPCREAVEAIAKLSPLVELGAGTGYWSEAIAAAGADIIATDACKRGKQNGYGMRVGSRFPVEHFAADAAVKAYPDRNVFVSWPCYRIPWATEAAKAMLPGRVLALIGEGEGGCTGTDCLFEYLGEAFEVIGGVEIPQWPGIGDGLLIYRKKEAA